MRRRVFLKNGALVLSAAGMDISSVFAESCEPVLKVGLITDLHYADMPPAGTIQYYRVTVRP